MRVGRFLKIFLFAAVTAILLKSFFIEAYRIPTGSMENTLMAGDFLLVNKFVFGPATPRTIPFTEIQIPYYRLPSVSSPKLNDVVVFEYPGNRDDILPGERLNYIKRCIGLPGDTIMIKDKIVNVNGKPIELPKSGKIDASSLIRSGYANPLIFPKGSKWNKDNYGPVIVPQKGDVIKLNLSNIETWRIFIDRELNKSAVKIIGSKIEIDGKVTDNYTVQNDYYFMLGDNRDDSADSRFWGFVPESNIIGRAMMVYWSLDTLTENPGFFSFISSIRWNRIGKLIN